MPAYTVEISVIHKYKVDVEADSPAEAWEEAREHASAAEPDDMEEGDYVIREWDEDEKEIANYWHSTEKPYEAEE